MRRTGGFYISIIGITFCLLAASLSADVIILNNGTRLEGLTESVRGDPDSITIRMGSGTITFNRDKISELIDEPDAVGHMKIGEQLLESQDYRAALGEFKRAHTLDPSLERAQQLIQATEQLLEQKERETQHEIESRINSLIDEAEELLSQLSYEEALDKLDEATSLGPSDAQLRTINRLKIKALEGVGMQQLDRFNERGAVETFQRILQLDPDNDIARSHLIDIWERDSSKLDEVIEAYKKIVEKNPEDKGTLYKLANALYEKEQWDSAVEAYERLLDDPAFNQDFIRARVKQVLERLHSSAARKAQYETARRYYRKLLELFPQTDPSPLYVYEYAEQRKETEPDDIQGHLELAEFCRENGLDMYAKREYEHILRREPDNEQAIEGLAYYAQKQYEEAEYFFDNNQYRLAIKIAEEILDDYPQVTDVVQKSSELIERANNELRRVMRQKEAEAKDLAQRGNEYFQRAEQYIDRMYSSERRSNVHIVSEREEAKKYLRRAIMAWEKALEIEPTLAQLSEEDLNNKLSDARQRLRVLENPVPMEFPVPRRIGR